MDNFMDKLAERYNAQEMIRANSQAETNQMEGLKEQVEAYEAVLQEMRKLNYKNTELTEKMYSLVDESIEKVRTLKIEASENGANTEQISREMSDAVIGTVKEALDFMDAKVDAIADSQSAIQDKLSNLSVDVEVPALNNDQINTFTQSVEGVSEQVYGLSNTLTSSIGAMDEKLTGIESMIGEVKEAIVAIEAASQVSEPAEAMEETTETEQISREIEPETEAVNVNAELTGAIESINNSLEEKSATVFTVINDINEKNTEIDTYVKGIWDSVEAQKGALQSIIDKPAGGRESDEMRAAVAEIASSVEEIRTGLRSVQNVQSESKDTLKTSLDSAIYGLKQDNREIVEFVQRMNTNLMASVNDPDKDKKEEEAVAKEEARKQEIEERFKQTEDFMHKESVKVYRNVQAVVNEKMDRHADNVELGNKQLVAQVAQVKTVAVIAALLSGIDIIINVLKIFGII